MVILFGGNNFGAQKNVGEKNVQVKENWVQKVFGKLTPEKNPGNFFFQHKS